MEYNLKYLKYKTKYLNLKYTGYIGGGDIPSVKLQGTALKRFNIDMKILGLGTILEPMSSKYYEITYNGNTFHISFPENYPFSPPTINGMIPTYVSPAQNPSVILDALIDSKPSAKNTLIYCHNKLYHWLIKTWNELFGENFTNSNKIYFDLEINQRNSKIFKGDGFSNDFLSTNNNLWDFIMIPDCGIPDRLPKEFGGLYNLTMKSEDIIKDTPVAFELLKRILLNLKIGGNLWLTKTITSELTDLIILELGPKYEIKFIQENFNDGCYYKNIPNKEGSNGVIITRLE